MIHPNAKVLYVYWGRRGALSQIALEVARHLGARPETGDTISISAENELVGAITEATAAAIPFATFALGHGALTGLLRARRQIDALVEHIRAGNYTAVVVLMSHVWTPLLGRRLRALPVRYLVVAHDAGRHPGDRTGLVQGWLNRDLRHADIVVALTEAVASRLVTERGVPKERIRIVPHPSLAYGSGERIAGSGPLRVLFMGRIMAYKGLRLLAEAVRDLRAGGRDVRLGVFGEGDIADVRPILNEIDAEIVNRWIDHDEIGAILARHDVLVLPYIEASQSGVAAAARGAGLPIIVTPVGGLVEQVRDGIDGLVASTVSADAIAECLARLADDGQTLQRLATASANGDNAISVAAFADRLKEIALEPR